MRGAVQLAAILVVGLSAIGGLVLVRLAEQRRLAATRKRYVIAFPRDLELDQVVAFLRSLATLLRPRRSPHVSSVILEVEGTHEGVQHRLVVSRGDADGVIGQLRAAIPNATVVLDEGPDRPVTAAHEFRLSTPTRELRREDPAAVATSVLGAMKPLGRGERLIWQWVLAPTRPKPLPPAPPVYLVRPPRGRWSRLLGVTNHRAQTRERHKAEREKLGEPLLQAVFRVGCNAAGSERRLQLLQRLSGVLRMVAAGGVHFRRRALPQVADRLNRAVVPVTAFPILINVRELVGLLGVPIGGPALAGISYASTKQLPPDPSIPSGVRVVAQATYPGSERPLALSVTDSLTHLLAIGPTGVGKSTLLGSLIIGDLEANRPIVVIDPKGDLLADVIARVPAHRVRDIVVLDPTDDRPIGLNPLMGAHRQPELAADQLLGIMHRLWASSWGPRTSAILHASLLTLAQSPGMTLVELPLLLSNERFRRQLVGRLDDPIALEPFWSAYEAMSVPERAQVTAPALNRMRQFILRPSLRHVLGQAESTISLGDVLNRGQVLLVSLAAGVLGQETAALMGSLLLGQLWLAIQGRAGLPADSRRPAFVTVDEFPMVANLPTPMGEILAQARGLGVGFALANQHVTQLSPELRESVMANCRAKVAFQLGAGDAAAMAREFGPLIAPGDLQGLGRHEVMASLPVGRNVVPPVTGRTRALPPVTGQGEAAKRASRERYGRSRDEVETAIRQRHQDRGEGPVRRRRRS
jgi:hypothetical protein